MTCLIKWREWAGNSLGKKSYSTVCRIGAINDQTFTSTSDYMATGVSVAVFSNFHNSIFKPSLVHAIVHPSP